MAGHSLSTTLSFILALSFTASQTEAQTFGPETIVTANADGANCLIAADIDGDGLVDLVGAEYYRDRVVWHRQTARGKCSKGRVIDADLDGAWHVRVADFDGDSDVVATGYSANAVHYMENLGGSWKITVLTTSSIGAGGIAVADLDGDGDQDIMAAAEGNNKLALFRNNGGTFVEQDIAVSNASAVTAFDGDGDRPGARGDDVLPAGLDEPARAGLRWIHADGRDHGRVATSTS